MPQNSSFILAIVTVLVSSIKCFPTISNTQQDKDLQVDISNGVLQGIKIVSEFDNTTFYGFLGIPYAQPPIGDLRFRAPRPALNWSGVLDATEKRSLCAQPSVGSEDCLFVNVYTPYTEKLQGNRSSLPVMVWIHGGAFVMGTSDVNNADNLLQHGVVVAAINYRLGVFGFLSTADMASPGNYGLKDQIEALKWVQRNIRHFGGDPSKVTIFGESAGAASVTYLLQTSLAKGLFHKAIAESGSSLCHWSLNREPKRIAYQIAELVNVVATNTEELVSKLRSVEFDELNSASEELTMEDLLNLYDKGLIFSPNIEPEHENAVLTKSSYSLLSSSQFNKVPLLIGFNSQETALLENAIDMIRPSLAQKDASPITIPHDNMNISSNLTKIKVGKAIKSMYFKNNSLASAPLLYILDFYSDDMFLRPIRKTVKLYSQSVPVYFYRFSYEGSSTLFGSDKRTVKGAAHAEELIYVFSMKSKIKSTTDALMARKIGKLWTNFAKTSNPTPAPEEMLNNITWPRVIKNGAYNFLDINNRLTLGVNPKEKEMKFWENLYQKYPPLDTC